MATLYQRLKENIKTQPKGFMLHPKHRNRLGIMIAKEWKMQPVSELDAVEMVTSIEENGSFVVANYPDYFTPKMDEMIKNYYKELLQVIKNRKTAPKQGNKTDSAPKKVRTRKPLQKEKQPVFRSNFKKVE